MAIVDFLAWLAPHILGVLIVLGALSVMAVPIGLLLWATDEYFKKVEKLRRLRLENEVRRQIHREQWR